MHGRWTRLGWTLALFSLADCSGNDDGVVTTGGAPDAASHVDGGLDAGSAGSGGSDRDAGRDGAPPGAADGGSDAAADGGGGDAGGPDASQEPVKTVEPLVFAGTRLGLRWREDGVGLRGFVDKQHEDTPCEFREIGGTYLCWPIRGTAKSLYADGSCSQSVILVDDGECSDDPAPGELVRLLGSDLCEPPELVRISDETIGLLYSNESGDCVEAAPDNTQGLWHPLEPVETSELVSATEEVIEAGALHVRRLVATDGTTLNFDVLTPDGDRCELLAERCVPGVVAYAAQGLRADSTCSDQAMVANVGFRCEEDYDYVLAYDSEAACGESFYDVYAAASRTDEAYRPVGSECTAMPGKYVVAGARVEDDALPELRQVLLGTGRIREFATANADGVALLPANSNPYDTELEATCSPHRFTDGETRCVTGILGNFIDLFSNDACTTALGVRVSAECATGEEARHYLYSEAPDACGVSLIAKLFEAVPYDGPFFRREEGSGQCVPTEAAPGSEFVAAGDEVPLARFATF